MSKALKTSNKTSDNESAVESAFAQNFAVASAAPDVMQLGGLIGSFRDAAQTINALARALEKQMPDGVPSDVLAILGQIAQQADSIAQGTRPAFESLGGLRETLENHTLSAELDAVAITALEGENNRDALTGSYNRRFFDAALARGTSEKARFSLILLDIDHFKSVNDTYGHPSGDRVLQELAATVSGVTRRKDTVFARLGGEEFVLLVPGTAAAANRVAERVRAACAARAASIAADGLYVPAVTVSLGVAGLRTGDTPETLLKRADEALYAAKKGGRNRVVNANTLRGENTGAKLPPRM